jgi:hypothetical protein
MPEPLSSNPDDILKLKAILKYFNASETYSKLEIKPGTTFVNVKQKGSPAEGVYLLLQSVLSNSTRYEAFLGKTPEQRALVRQWVNYNLQYVAKNRLQSNAILKELDGALTNYTFFAGHSFTIADVLFYYNLHQTYQNMSFEDKEKYQNLQRWFALVQEDRDLRQRNSVIQFSRTPLYA